MKDFIQRNLLKVVTAGARVISRIHSPWINKRVKAHHYHAILGLMSPGMVLLSKTDGQFSSLFIPGEFTHAAFVGDDFGIIEAVTKCVSKSDLIDFMMTKDRVVLLTPTFATLAQMEDASTMAQQFVGTPYDFGMSYSPSDVKAFFCSELIYYCYERVMSNSPFKLRKVFGVSTVAPSDFYLAEDKFTVVFDTDKA